MKKDALFLSLTFVVVVLCGNYLTLSSPLSEISKVIILIWFNFACLSVALLVRRVLLVTWSTTKRPAGLNLLSTLAAKERVIQARVGLVTRSQTSDSYWLDEWETLNERDRKNNTECNHKCRWEHGGKCCYCSIINPSIHS